VDRDILEITRRRHQEGRCVGCGKKPGKTLVLCDWCAGRGRCYCPECESVYDHPATRLRRRNSQLCNPCKRKRHGRPTREGRPWRSREEDLRARRARKERELAHIQRLYRQNMPIEEIARRVGAKVPSLKARIRRARHQGFWPEYLRR
jgi:hypothetical protein